MNLNLYKLKVPLQFRAWKRILLFVSYLRFPKYPSFFFPYHAFLFFLKIKHNPKMYKIYPIPIDLMNLYLKSKSNSFDANNTVLICDERFYELNVNEFNICLISSQSFSTRVVQVFNFNVPKDVLLVSDNLFHNLNVSSNDLDLKVKIIPIDNKSVVIATEIEVALVNTYYDISNAITDTLLNNYFKTPKILASKDILSMNLKEYAPEYYYSNTILHQINTVHFKCVKCSTKDSVNFQMAVFCILNETTLKQNANIRSYVPRCIYVARSNLKINNSDNFQHHLLIRCPSGLKEHQEKIEKSVKPFIFNNKISIWPVFLVQGNKGCGKKTLVSTLAAKLGLNYINVPCGELNSTAYAQTEIKIRSLFFKAKLCSPCILSLSNFEEFGKNNEGRIDPRITQFYQNELQNLFRDDNFPLILMCLSNSKDLPPDISRIFLETFEIPTPTQTERADILSWLLFHKNVTYECDLDEICGKTHGFVYGDLDALIFHAQKYNIENKNTPSLKKEDFEKALDKMQSSYSKSLGAPKIPNVQWADVGGLNELKEEIMKTINLPLQYPKLLKKAGLKRSGILLYGPPGTGKTLIAKAVATECNLCFLSVKGPELLNMYVGQSEQNVRQVFERAREASPCIIFFDELDSLAPNRGISGDSGGVMDRVVSQLLAEMDGLNQSATIFVIGATNRPDLLDPALLRPGRFDKLLYVGPCGDTKSKLSVLRALTRKFKIDEGVVLKNIIKYCPPNITGADLYAVCSNAWLCAVRKTIEKLEANEITHGDQLTPNDIVVTMQDFEDSAKQLKPSISEEDLKYFNQLHSQVSTNAQ